MSTCPLCGAEVTVVPYFDVTEPAARKYAVLHSEQTSCPASTEAPPRPQQGVQHGLPEGYESHTR